MSGWHQTPEGTDREGIFNQVYEEHHRAIHAYLYGRTSDADAALDLLQDTFIRVWRNLESLQDVPQERHRFWILTVAKNLVTDHYRRSSARTGAYEAFAQAAELSRPSINEQEWTEELLIMDEAIRELPESLRVLLALRVLGGLSSKEIASLVGRSAATVRYQISIARKRLREYLSTADAHHQSGGRE